MDILIGVETGALKKLFIREFLNRDRVLGKSHDICLHENIQWAPRNGDTRVEIKSKMDVLSQLAFRSVGALPFGVAQALGPGTQWRGWSDNFLEEGSNWPPADGQLDPSTNAGRNLGLVKGGDRTLAFRVSCRGSARPRSLLPGIYSCS